MQAASTSTVRMRFRRLRGCLAIMNHLLKEDIIKTPDLALVGGKLPVIAGPGLGFEIDWDAVSRAAEAHTAHVR